MSVKKNKNITMGLGMLLLPGLLFAQGKNQIGVQTGLLHYYFEESPILNTNYVAPSGNGLYRGIFLNSYGLEYSRKLNDNGQLSFEASFLGKAYRRYFESYDQLPGIGIRKWTTVGIHYSRRKVLSERFTLLYGGGVNYRHGYEAVIVAGALYGYPNSNDFEPFFLTVQRRDLGLNAFGRVEYTISKFFYAYSKLDFLGFVYMHDKENRMKMKDVYDAPQFPTRYDLSLKFGIGVRF